MGFTAEQLAERRQGIGSSEAAAVCGVSPWSTALEVYMRKLGELPEQAETPEMRWGTALEPVIAIAYQHATGMHVNRVPIRQHPDLPWMFASIDGLRADGRIVEIKTANAWSRDEWGEPGSDEIPEAYLCQVAHQLAVAGKTVADVAVLIGGNDFRIYHVPRNQVLIDQVIEIEREFWARVQRRFPPEPDWAHARTPKLIEAMHGLDPSKIVTLDEEAATLATNYEGLAAFARESETKRQEYKARLLHLMGDAGVALLPDGRTITRREVDRSAYTVEAIKYVDFRIRKAKVKK